MAGNVRLDEREGIAFRVIGRPVVRDDVRRKVAGEVLYSADWVMPGMLYGKLVRSIYPHAKIRRLDFSRAYQVPGVVRIVSAADVPVNQFYDDPAGLGQLIAQHRVFQDDEVRYVGEPICLVLAESSDAADYAAQAVDIEYEELPAVHDPLDALEPEAVLVHATGNLVVEWNVRKGNLAGIKDNPELRHFSRSYTTQYVDHLYLEPEAGVGWLDNDGILTLRCTTQVLEHYRAIARMLNLPDNRVRVIAPYVGGGFGGKEDMTVEPYVAIGVWITRRPVKMVWSRQESLIARPKRHPFRMTYDVWVTPAGEIAGMQVDILADAGAYALLSPRVVFAAAVVATGPYRIEHVAVKARAVYTHNVPTSAFRGFGAMQMAVGYEQFIDELAQALNRDPISFRRQHFIAQGDVLATGEVQETRVMLPEALSEVLSALGPKPYPSQPGRRVGRGIACTMQPYGRTVWFQDQASCWMNVESDGSVVLRIGVPDIGGGQAFSLCQITAEILGVPLDMVRPYYGDSALTPLAGGTFATRQLYMSGNAVYQAASELKDVILGVVRDTWGTANWHLDDHRAVSSTGQTVGFAEIYRAATALQRPLEVHTTFYAPVGPKYDNVEGRAMKTFPDFTFGCHGVDLEIDEETGQVVLLQYAASHDVGVAINPVSVKGQILGGVAQGLGYALSEEVVYQSGQCLTSLFSQYMAPVAPDVPDIKVIILESGEGRGPFHARGIGEPAISPVAPAVANAVADALASGDHVRSLPLTADKIWRQMRQK
ncbi:xanthine dehydrogenase, molybdenum binding subunit apoprotein [Sulfobacillus acidophilus TPY]|uniref:Xanthine dehydrogenase n=1 Tax=Sulfobacillus acidophilus (strain ATCC 700253 / DSM 10332 / NAL) TaxID=679936 RepID=G8TUQ5_SULAD|nr:xanthine dehydrogenase, molybdenum binding subunit apoprotein [Sulfobacillus acidophilus TPY]AEW05779.1 Xanthine dehydrogenase [Sulfobacillus acidophilus DSM 10332]